jgi:arylsulfatase A
MKKLKDSIYCITLIAVSSIIISCKGEEINNKGNFTPQMPNILFVLADDFGYGSLNCYGADESLVKTPNIDLLSEQGIRFTDASTPSAVCSPTRYALLTGEYNWRTDKKYGVVDFLDPFSLDIDKPILASWLKQKGYSTAVIGKWHMGFGTKRMQPQDFLEPLRPGPLEAGFNYYFGLTANHGEPSGIYVENDHIYGLRSDKMEPFGTCYYSNRGSFYGFDAPQRVDEHVMDTLTNKAISWLKQQDRKKPFFLYFASTAVHEPVTPSPHNKGKSNSGKFGDYIQDLDRSVGRLLESLEEMNLTENTLVIFTSDNGASISRGNSAIQAGLKINGSLKGGKGMIWEGGVRVPFIARWPGKIAEGTVSNTMINCTVDIFATFFHLINGKLPSPGQAGPDSFSFLNELYGNTSMKTNSRESMIVTNRLGIMAIRRGPWKYIEGKYPEKLPDNRKPANDLQAKPQLYNLDDDLGENYNLINKYPEIAAQLKQELNSIRSAGNSIKLKNNL